jgi:hypothetical protein
MLSLFIFDRFDSSGSAFAFAKEVGGTVYLPELDGGIYPQDLTPPVVYVEVEADSLLDEHESVRTVERYFGRFAYVMHKMPDDAQRIDRQRR